MYRNRRQQVVAEDEMTQEQMEEEEFGTRSKVSLLDQHSELKKKAEGKSKVVSKINYGHSVKIT